MLSRLRKDVVVTTHIDFLRSLRPVGQGAFYTEVFKKDDGTLFTVVYDCGTETDSSILEAQIDEFKKEITQIDLLFISHFHKDHISGLDKLLKKIPVIKTVIPMLPAHIMTLARVQNLLQCKEEALAADAIIKELYLSDKTPKRFGKVIVVEPLDYSDLSDEEKGKGLGERAKSGSCIDGFESLWEYVPFNSVSIPDQRAIDFMKGLKDITGALDNDGNLHVSKIIRGCRTKVMALYKDVMKGADENLYTMTVESRPSGSLAKGSDPSVVREARCLYTGDFDSVGNDSLWNRFTMVYDYPSIGTVQIPHHGSKRNWRQEFLEGAPRRFFISVGTTNTYHHPDFWVTQEVRDRDNTLDVITERVGSGVLVGFSIVEC